jgi:hypothetical protein
MYVPPWWTVALNIGSFLSGRDKYRLLKAGSPQCWRTTTKRGDDIFKVSHDAYLMKVVNKKKSGYVPGEIA